MNAKDTMDDFEQWVAGEEIQVSLSRVASFERDNFKKWLRFAFTAGAEAQKDKKVKLLWPDSAVEAERTRLHALGVSLP